VLDLSGLSFFRRSPVGPPCSSAAGVLGFVLSGMFWPQTARALEYDYDVPASCPSRETFLSEVRSRLRYPAEQSTVERLRVSVRQQQGFEASFVLIEPGQPPVTRTLTAEVCGDAMQALALGAALALDARYREVRGIPEAELTEVPAPGVVPPAQAAVDSAAPPVASAPAPAVGVPAVQAPPVPPASPPPSQAAAAPPAAVGPVDVATQEPVSETPDAAVLTMAVRLGAFAATGYSPDPSFGPSAGVLLQSERFAVGLDAFVSSENRASNGEQSADFWVVGGRLYPCLRWPIAEFRARGCGVLEFSGVHAEGVDDGSEVVRTEAAWVPYWAIGAGVGAEAPLTPALSLSIDLGVQFPLSDRSFFFANADEPLHEFPTVAARGQLAICYAF